MSRYEKYIEEVEEGKDQLSDEALEAAADALSFVLSLHNMFAENGVDVPEEPSCTALENIMDGVMGELAAACLFLSEDNFEEVPGFLRQISKSFEKADTLFTDPDGVTSKSVPDAVKKGYSRLADRIDATRFQKQQMLSVLNDHKKRETNQ